MPWSWEQYVSFSSRLWTATHLSFPMSLLRRAPAPMYKINWYFSLLHPENGDAVKSSSRSVVHTFVCQQNQRALPWNKARIKKSWIVTLLTYPTARKCSTKHPLVFPPWSPCSFSLLPKTLHAYLEDCLEVTCGSIVTGGISLLEIYFESFKNGSWKEKMLLPETPAWDWRGRRCYLCSHVLQHIGDIEQYKYCLFFSSKQFLHEHIRSSLRVYCNLAKMPVSFSSSHIPSVGNMQDCNICVSTKDSYL